MSFEARTYIVSVTSWTPRQQEDNKTECQIVLLFISLSTGHRCFFFYISWYIYNPRLSPPFANLYALIILSVPNLSPCILACSSIPTPYESSSPTSFIVSFSLSICTLHHFPGPTTSSNIQSTCVSSCLRIRRFFF